MSCCPSCSKRGYVVTSVDITEFITHTNYSFHCGHYRNVRKVVQ